MSEFRNGRAESGAETGMSEVREMDVREMGVQSVDDTLRMIARMPAPEGLEERVKAGVRLAEKRGRLLAWPGRGESLPANAGWMRSGWARGAAAAAIALVVAGGGWGIYTRVAPAQSAKTVVMPQAQPSGTFSEAGAMRRPQTVTGPTVAGPDALKPIVQPVPKKTGNIVGAGTSGAAKLHATGSASHATATVQ